MTEQQKETLVNIISFKYADIRRNQAYRMIDYAYDVGHSNGMLEVVQVLTDIIYIVVGRYDIGANELLEAIQ